MHIYIFGGLGVGGREGGERERERILGSTGTCIHILRDFNEPMNSIVMLKPLSMPDL